MSRDRDAEGRPRNARLRDALGRPLARDAGGTPAADPPALPPPEALREAQRLLDDDRAFAAHEILEAVWKATPGRERALWRGLAQLAVGLTHQARGNDVGARSLFQRGADTLASVPAEAWGVPIQDLRSWASLAATSPESAGPMPRLTVQAADDRA